MTYILIIGINYGLVMQEFKTHETCMAAKETVEAYVSTGLLECLKK